MIMLDIGAGLYPQTGYTPVDKFVTGPGYVNTDAWNLEMYKNGCVDAIWSSHMLEHLEKRMVPITLKEWARVLKAKGKLVIEVPDLVWCCKNWLNHRTDDWHLDALFGNQDPPGGQGHQTGFTVDILVKRLQEAGFVVDTVRSIWNHNQECIYAEAHKGN